MSLAGWKNNHGFTLLELSLTCGIVAVLMAMIVGLCGYGNASIEISKCRSELCEWGNALHNWYLKYGEYPWAQLEGATLKDKMETDSSQYWKNISNLVDRTDGVWIGNKDHSFSATLVRALPIADPWGHNYIYIPDPDHKSYVLFSMGPDGKSAVVGNQDKSTSLDDIYFER